MTHSDHVVAMETVSEERLPCPFCGGDAHYQTDTEEEEFAEEWIGCVDCGATAAVEVWARRAPSELIASRLAKQAPATHRHIKRGSEYGLIGVGKMQAENWIDDSLSRGGVSQDGPHVTPFRETHPVDMREVAIYRSVDDGSLWVHPLEEFEDGRFEGIPSPVLGEPK